MPDSENTRVANGISYITCLEAELCVGYFQFLTHHFGFPTSGYISEFPMRTLKYRTLKTRGGSRWNCGSMPRGSRHKVWDTFVTLNSNTRMYN
jgi:hypothetical protein